MYFIFSDEQIKIIVACGISIMVLLGVSSSFLLPLKLIPFILIIGICAGFFKYARTHELLRKSKALFGYHIRKNRGEATLERFNKKNIEIIKSLYPIRTILKGGCLDFGGGRYGYMIRCTPRKNNDDEVHAQIENIARFLDSLNSKILLKISAAAQIPNINACQDMVNKKLSNKKTAAEKQLLYSIYEMSASSPRPVQWSFVLFLALESNAKEIDALSGAILPGILRILENARIPARILTDSKSILGVYANDFSSIRIDAKGRGPALFGDKSIYAEVSRRLMPGKIQEKEDHVIINGSEFVSCLIVGLPRGGVSGFPSDLSYNVLSQLFELSTSKEQLIRIDLTVWPIESHEATKDLKKAMDKIDVNKETAKHRLTTVQDLQIEREDYEVLLRRLKNGEDKLFHVSYVISVYSPSYELLTAGLSRVRAVLGANSILAEIPYGNILTTLKNSKLIPHVYLETSIELPTSALSRITPIISNSCSLTSKDGAYFGNDGDEEIIINLDEMAAAHTLAIGATGSGKTTGLLLMMTRDVIFQDRKVIYCTIKADAGTNYRNVAEYFGSDSQIIDLGRKSEGERFYNVNPLEIMVDHSATFDPENIFYRHISILKKFFSVLLKTDSVNQAAYLELSLIEIYDQFGMKPYDASTWDPETPPTLKDLHELWARDKGDNVSAEALFNKSIPINYSWKFLSNKTNVDLSKKFTVIDLSGIPADLSEAMNYLLTSILSLRFNTNAEQKTSIYLDEGRVFLKNPQLADDIVTYLTQARSAGVRLILATQSITDLKGVSDEFKSNTFVSLIFGNNIDKSIDPVADFFKLGNADIQYLKSCTRKGEALLVCGPPYSQSYKIYMKLSPLEEQIIFGKKQTVDSGFKFLHSDLEAFAKEQGVIFGDWIQGDASELRQKRTGEFQQRTVGSGRSYAYIDPEIIQEPGKILNQNNDHYLGVVYLGGSLISKGIKVEVNHFDSADVIGYFPGGPVAFEYQSSGNNTLEKLMQKRKNGESTYGRMFFIGDSQSTKEMRKILNDNEIVISRGAQLEILIGRLLNEKQNLTDKTRPF